MLCLAEPTSIVCNQESQSTRKVVHTTCLPCLKKHTHKCSALVLSYWWSHHIVQRENNKEVCVHRLKPLPFWGHLLNLTAQVSGLTFLLYLRRCTTFLAMASFNFHFEWVEKCRGIREAHPGRYLLHHFLRHSKDSWTMGTVPWQVGWLEGFIRWWHNCEK